MLFTIYLADMFWSFKLAKRETVKYFKKYHILHKLPHLLQMNKMSLWNEMLKVTYLASALSPPPAPDLEVHEIQEECMRGTYWCMIPLMLFLQTFVFNWYVHFHHGLSRVSIRFLKGLWFKRLPEIPTYVSGFSA